MGMDRNLDISTIESSEAVKYGALDVKQSRLQNVAVHSPNGNGLSRPIPFDGLLMNKLLTALPGGDLAGLLSYLEPVSLKAGCNVYDLGQDVDFVYFPETAIVSHIYSLADGNTTEAAIIGNEGLVGLCGILDSHAPTYWTQVLIGGTAVKVSREFVKQQFVRSASMQEVLLRYMNVLLSHLAQRGVCNGSHLLDRRLSTWFLMIHDRANGDSLALTHEEIADHLGARRAGITSACSSLRAAGAIDYSRGQMKILDRNILQTSACECYESLRMH